MIPALAYVRAAAASVLVAISATPAQPQAQPHGFPVSQRGSVTQMVAFTEISIAYVIFSSAAHVFHKPYPGARFDVLRVDVTPEQASQMDSFAIYFPMVMGNEAVLRLHWGTTAVPLRIKAPFRPPS
jgi:hypothetical protein